MKSVVKYPLLYRLEFPLHQTLDDFVGGENGQTMDDGRVRDTSTYDRYPFPQVVVAVYMLVQQSE